MAELADIISGEFEEAMEVKNPKSLHRGIYLLLSATVRKEEHTEEHNGLKSALSDLGRDIKLIATEIREGFKRMDERFETVDMRFETMQKQMNQRFEMVEKRFIATDQRFVASDQRFEVITHQLESMDHRYTQRFEAVDKRFEAMDKKFNRLTVLITTLWTLGFLGLGTLITILKFFS